MPAYQAARWLERLKKTLACGRPGTRSIVKAERKKPWHRIVHERDGVFDGASMRTQRAIGTEIEIMIRNKPVKATVTRKKFYKREE